MRLQHCVLQSRSTKRTACEDQHMAGNRCTNPAFLQLIQVLTIRRKQISVGFWHGTDAATDVASHATTGGIGFKASSMFKMQPSLTSALGK